MAGDHSNRLISLRLARLARVLPRVWLNEWYGRGSCDASTPSAGTWCAELRSSSSSVASAGTWCEELLRVSSNGRFPLLVLGIQQN